MGARKKGELTENEKQLIDSVNEGKLQDVQRLLAERDVHVDCLDEHGMTPLQHAAYKGNQVICDLLLSNGADVNSNHHDHGYTTLMFGALSGHLGVTRLLLEHGANPRHVNSVGRTASQMAAFVGQNRAVTLINNFISKRDLEYYTAPHDLEAEPRLPSPLVSPLYEYIQINNLSPLKLVFFLRDHPELLSQGVKIRKFLDFMCEKMMKQKETNEVLGIKFHYLGQVVEHAQKKFEEGSMDKWIKSLARGRASDGLQEAQEVVIRAALKNFPYIQNQLIQQMVRSIAASDKAGSPGALTALETCISGRHFKSDDEHWCETCNEEGAKLRCSKCKTVYYCGQPCQKFHWSTHKKKCDALADEFNKMEEIKIEQEKATKKELQELEQEEKETKKKQECEQDEKETHQEHNVTSE